jgi:hypothetical protein
MCLILLMHPFSDVLMLVDALRGAELGSEAAGAIRWDFMPVEPICDTFGVYALFFVKSSTRMGGRAF